MRAFGPVLAVIFIASLVTGGTIDSVSPSAVDAAPARAMACPMWGTCTPSGLGIWTDKHTYGLGEQVTVCYAVPTPGYVAIYLRRPNDGTLITAGLDDGTGDCSVYGLTGLPTGPRTITIFFWPSGTTATAFAAAAAPTFSQAQSSAVTGGGTSADNTYSVVGASCAPTCPASVSTDRSQYSVGDAITVCFNPHIQSHVVLTLYPPSGSSSVIYDKDDDGTGGCFAGGTASLPAGAQRIHMDVYQESTLIGRADATYTVNSPQVPPGGVWDSPTDGITTTGPVHFAAEVKIGSAPIQRVEFTASLSGQWTRLCVLTSPSSSTTYQCDVNLQDWGAPAGPTRISFDVYDQAGQSNLAPQGERTIYFSPPARPSPTNTPTPTPTDTPTPTPPPTSTDTPVVPTCSSWTAHFRADRKLVNTGTMVHLVASTNGNISIPACGLAITDTATRYSVATCDRGRTCTASIHFDRPGQHRYVAQLEDSDGRVVSTSPAVTVAWIQGKQVKNSIDNAGRTLWNITDTGNMLCGYLHCVGWDKTLTSKAISLISKLTTALDFGKITGAEVKQGKDLVQLKNDLHKYGRHSFIVKNDALIACTDNQTVQRGLYDLFPWPINDALNKLLPVPSCIR